MYRTILPIFIFLSLYLFRFFTFPSPLPSNWSEDIPITLTLRLTDFPEVRPRETWIRFGQWLIIIPNFADLEPGQRLTFTGIVKPTYFLGKIISQKLLVTNFQPAPSRSPSITSRVYILLSYFRKFLVTRLSQSLPEPEASLAAGVLLGVKRSLPTSFQTALVNTGTMHIVAASGYNVNIVAGIILGSFTLFLSRFTAIPLALVGIWLYVLLAGGGAAVVRAGIMGSLTLVGQLFGRPTLATRLFLLSAAIMLLLSPYLIFDIGFQLSFAATFGLLYFSNFLSGHLPIRRFPKLQDFLVSNWWPTISATIATLPITLYHFGRASFLSPFANLVVLPVVPLIMFLAALVLLISFLFPPLSSPAAWFLYVPTHFFVWFISLFG